MANEKRLIDANKARVVAQRIYSDPVLVHAILNTLNNTPTVDAVEVDEIKLHYILIDNEGVPEVKLQFGNRYFILHTDPVDVREVVHGRWVHVPSSDMMTGKAYICSECKKMRYGSFMPNYCPNCGAKMDGDGNA